MLDEKIKQRIIDTARKLKEPMFKHPFAQMVGVDKGTISRYVDFLEHEGRIKVKHMGRFYLIQPAEKNR